MDWFTKHVDSIATIATVIGAMIWMNGKFNSIEQRFSVMEKDMAIIKTVLVMKEMMPKELACTSGDLK
jgi:hypothetical protein